MTLSGSLDETPIQALTPRTARLDETPVTGLAILLAIGLAVLWTAGVVLSAWALLHPPRRTYSAAVARGRAGDPSELSEGARAFDTWELECRGRRLPVWDVKGDDAGGPVVVLTHGWGDSRIGGLVRLPALLPVASRVLLWDMPGHGEAPGVCGLGVGEVQDLIALLDRVAGQRVVLMGWSLGAGVSIAAAARTKLVSGVIAEAPYRLARTPATNVIRSRGLPASIIMPVVFAMAPAVVGGGIRARRFDRCRHAAGLACPLLVIHGSDDAVCPCVDGREIAAAGRGEMIEVAGAGHNDLWTDESNAARCAAAVRRFIQHLRA